MKVRANGSGLVLIFVMTIAALGAAAAAAPAARPANVVIILADDLGFGDLACYGCPDTKTPVLDQMAREGARFTDGYAAGPLCSPTRVAMMSGRYQQRFGNSFEDYMGGQFPGLDATKHTTVAMLMKQAGYKTAIFGKWNISGGRDEDKIECSPMGHGFDQWFGVHANHDYHTHFRGKQPDKADLWENGKPITRKGYTDDLITEDAVAYVLAHKSEPFFLYLPYLSPHNPLQTFDDPTVHPDGDRATYVKMVEHLDHNIGRVLDTIKSSGIDENTIVLFTSDNGGQKAARNLPCSGRKGQLLEGGIREPMVVRYPGTVPAGQTIHYPAITMDFTATALAVANAKVPSDQPLDGINLLPILTGHVPTEPRTLYWRLRAVDYRAKTNEIAARAIREGDWKIYWRGKKPKLFNLKDDIAEAKDVSQENPEVTARLSKKLEDWEKAVTPPGEFKFDGKKK